MSPETIPNCSPTLEKQLVLCCIAMLNAILLGVFISWRIHHVYKCFGETHSCIIVVATNTEY